MTCYACTDEVRVNVPSFQKVTLFLRYKIFHTDLIRLHFCLFEDVTDNKLMYSSVYEIQVKVDFDLRPCLIHTLEGLLWISIHRSIFCTALITKVT